MGGESLFWVVGRVPKSKPQTEKKNNLVIQIQDRSRFLGAI